jgi:hypothetical protein
MDLAPRLVLPRLDLPQAPTMPVPTLEIPTPQIPRYKPLVVPPSDLRAPPGVKGGVNNDPPPKPTILNRPKLPDEVREITLPGTDINVPVPSTPVLTAAATTAVVSVGAGMIATVAFKRLVDIIKPILQRLLKRKKKDE